MIFENKRLRELEQENQQWQQWYQAQQLPPQYPQYPQPYQPLPPPKAKKKAKKAKNKVNPNPLSNEAKMWIFITIVSFFALIIVKNWITDATTPQPERVEKRKK